MWSRWIDGSTSGTAKDNCALWSNKLGFSGPTSACEWRTNSGSGRANVELLNWETLAAGPLIVRMRCKVETYAVSKVWLLFNTIYADPLWEMYVDVTPDNTFAANRVGFHSPEWSDVWVEEHPSHPGWMFIKARLDLTGAADVDGSFTVQMTDGNPSFEVTEHDLCKARYRGNVDHLLRLGLYRQVHHLVSPKRWHASYSRMSIMR